MLLRAKLAAWCDAHADPQWRKAHRMLSVQLAVLQAVLNGLYSGVGVLQNYVTPLEFIAANVGLSLLLLVCRLLDQKGFDDA